MKPQSQKYERLLGMEYINDIPCYQVKIFNNFLKGEYEPWRNFFEKKSVSIFDYTLPFKYKTVGNFPSNGWQAFILLYDSNSKTGENDLEEKYLGTKSQLNVPDGSLFVTVNTAQVDPKAWEEDDAWLLLRLIIQTLVLVGKVHPNFIYMVGYGESAAKLHQIIRRLADYLAGAGFIDIEETVPKLSSLENVPLYIHAEGDTLKEIKEFFELLKKQSPLRYKRQVKISETSGESVNQKVEAAFNWLNFKERNPSPTSVMIKVTPDEEIFISHWLLAFCQNYRNFSYASGSIADKNTIRISCRCVEKIVLRLNDILVDFTNPIRIIINGVSKFNGLVEESVQIATGSLKFEIDPYLMYFYQVSFDTKDSYI